MPKLSKTCDDCRLRKVRCLPTNTPSCAACTKRKVYCHFSLVKKRTPRAWVSTPPSNSASGPVVSGSRSPPNLELGTTELRSRSNSRSSSEMHQISESHPPKLYIDHLLEDRRTDGRRRNESSVIKANNHYVGSSGLAFFSEQRIVSISERLRNTKLRDHLTTLATFISSRMSRDGAAFGPAMKFSGSSPALEIPPKSVRLYISAYFVHVHPLYPFLDRKSFEEKAFSASQAQHQQGSSHFSALYHAVLALGCQHQARAISNSEKGMDWKLFRVSIKLISDILVPKEELVNVQALIAMAIFAQNSSCLQVGNMLISEAARMSQMLGFNKTSQEDNDLFRHRTFWVVYFMEKMASFTCGRTSILNDFDIGCPIPETPDSVFQGFDWLLAMTRLSRLISRTYELIFSISATLNSPDLYYANIENANKGLESWRKSIPELFRPGEPFQPTQFWDEISLAVAIRTHYYYYNVVVALSRMSLQLDSENPFQRKSKSKEILLATARAVVELTRFITTDSHAPVWIWASMPLSALFILFDFVIHNPTHSETKSNLSLLGVAAGYFCSMEYASGGSLPGSLLSEFAHIAREYVHEIELKTTTTEGIDNLSLEPSASILVPQSPPPSISANYGESLDQRGTCDLTYPMYDIPFSEMTGLPEGIDITNFFDTMMMDWVDPIPGMGIPGSQNQQAESC